jgi:hypothetical protein
MRLSKMCRNISLCVLIWMGISMRSVLAAEIDDFCSNWDDCSCEETFPNYWTWTGSCDFSEHLDPLTEGVEFCDALGYACEDTCNDPDYVDDLVEEHCNPNQYPPDPACNEGCWFPYVQSAYCTAGEHPEFNCSCGAWMWCDSRIR